MRRGRPRWTGRATAIGFTGPTQRASKGSPIGRTPGGRRGWLYLKGVSTGQFEEALTALLGSDAPGLSASTVRRLVASWQLEHERWLRRDLGSRRYVYSWAHGGYFTPRLDHDRQCILILIGADVDGRKELMAIEDGFRESAQSWRELLLRLTLQPPPSARHHDSAPDVGRAAGQAAALPGHHRWMRILDNQVEPFARQPTL